MLKNRKDLLDTAEKMYISLMERVAHRYYTDEQYVVTDAVGFEVTKIEDIFRPMWGIAPVLKERDPEINVLGKKMKITDFITDVMLSGTAPDSPKRFDRNVTEFNQYGFANQAITELAAYLLTVYFDREKLWDALPSNKREQIASWITKWAVCALKHSWPNNHYWYPIICIEMLTQLGCDCGDVEADMRYGYDFLETLYYDKGWYSDGELGRFDYYEAWAHHTYTLLWSLIADKTKPGYEEKCAKYRARSTEFLKFFSHYFDSDGGMCAYGRSIGYRFAAITPFALAALTGCDIDLGQAKNIVLKNISYFFDNSIPTRDGCFPCGYLYESTGFVEGYATDGAISCYTEGLMTLLIPEEHGFWTSEINPLPIELGDYKIKSPLNGLEIMICGEDKKNGVTLFNNSLHYYQKGASHRFNDMASYYSKFCYNSRAGFGISTADLVSSENMISICTSDGTLVSHRKKINDMAYDDGVFSSSHTPFSNDAKTTVKTYLIPLSGGWHARVHKVALSQKYSILEGGFSVGLTDDGYTVNENRITYGDKISEIWVVSNTETSYTTSKIQPGMHLLKPQALYPCYKTPVLDAGEYIFAASVCFVTDGSIENRPEITIKENTVIINQGENEKVIEL